MKTEIKDYQKQAYKQLQQEWRANNKINKRNGDERLTFDEWLIDKQQEVDEQNDWEYNQLLLQIDFHKRWLHFNQGKPLWDLTTKKELIEVISDSDNY